MVASALHKIIGMQLYKNNACMLLSLVLSILNSDWLQHALGVHRVRCNIMQKTSWKLSSSTLKGGTWDVTWPHPPLVSHIPEIYKFIIIFY